MQQRRMTGVGPGPGCCRYSLRTGERSAIWDVVVSGAVLRSVAKAATYHSIKNRFPALVLELSRGLDEHITIFRGYHLLVD